MASEQRDLSDETVQPDAPDRISRMVAIAEAAEELFPYLITWIEDFGDGEPQAVAYDRLRRALAARRCLGEQVQNL